MSKQGRIGAAAMKADMDRKTARKYLQAGQLPSQMETPREWRTRPDPFEEHWPELVQKLQQMPELEAKTLFDELTQKHPERYEPGQLRTLQRRVQHWRTTQGPEQEVMLAQRHRPGEAAQTDFTHATELGVTIAGVALVHLLCVFVLPFSNWLWATICTSESMAALRKGIQRALFQLGRVPLYHQTDNSTAATHQIPVGQQALQEGGNRTFNKEYLSLMQHFGMTARTTKVGQKQQNGDVESHNGGTKRRLKQALLLRGSTDFDRVEDWQEFIDQVNRKANATRGARLAEELLAMRELNVSRLPEYTKLVVRVSDWSTIRVRHCAYSVPSRLIGEMLQVQLYEDRLEARYKGNLELCCERLIGRNLHRIDYRHIVRSLVRKPGGFERYVYREEMFPTLVFRLAYDIIQTPHRGVKGDLEYLRILSQAAYGLQSDVEAALDLLLQEKRPVTAQAVQALVAGQEQRTVLPEMLPAQVDLGCYDELLGVA